MSLRDWWRWFSSWFAAHVGIWFDPDMDFRSVDKIQHAFGCFAIALLLVWLLPKVELWPLTTRVLFWTLVIGLVYECGQTDVARSQRLLGKPGFGIGLVDLFFDGAGGAVLLLLRFTLRLL